MKFVDATGNIKFGKAIFFGNNIVMSEQQDGIVTINAAVLSGTGSKLSLLGDVQITNIQDDQFVRWNAGTSLWINQFLTAADIGPGTFKTGQFVFPASGNTPVVALGDASGGLTQLSGTSVSMIVNGNEIERWSGQNTTSAHLQIFRSIDIFHSGGMPASSTISRFGYGPTGGSGWQIFIDSGTAVTDNSRLGFILWGGAIDSNHTLASTASIEVFASGNWATGNTPSFISFKTTAAGTSGRVEEYRMDSNAFYPLTSGNTLGTPSLPWGAAYLGYPSLSQVGLSSVYAPGPKVIVNDGTDHTYSGTVEGSITSYTLKANSMNKDGTSARIEAWIRSQAQIGEWEVKLGNAIIASGTISNGAHTWLICNFYRQSAIGVRNTYTWLSGTPVVGAIPATVMWNAVFNLVSVDFTTDQVIDFRARVYSGAANTYIGTALVKIIIDTSP